MAQQTAVKFIEQELINVKDGYQYIVLGGEEYVNTKHIKYLLEQAKQMEKEQLMRTARLCHFEGVRQSAKQSEEYIKYGEEYYNQTYKPETI